MPSSAGRWRGQGSPGGDERSEHALDAAERLRNRSCGPPSTRIRPDRVPCSRRAGSVNAEPTPPGFFNQIRPPCSHASTARVSGARQRVRFTRKFDAGHAPDDRVGSFGHSMIRSARCNSAGDTVRPRVRAVFTLITSSKVAGCSAPAIQGATGSCSSARRWSAAPAPMGLRGARSSSRSSRGRPVIDRGDRGAAPSPRGARSRGLRLGRSSPPARSGAWFR